MCRYWVVGRWYRCCGPATRRPGPRRPPRRRGLGRRLLGRGLGRPRLGAGRPPRPRPGPRRWPSAARRLGRRGLGGSPACHRPDAARAAPTGRRPGCGAGPGPDRPAAGAVPTGRRRTGPAGCPARAGRPGRSMSEADITASPTTPPLTIRFGFARAKSRRALATALTSPWTKAIAVGPVSSRSCRHRGVGHGQADQGVLVDLVVAAGGRQLTTELGQLGDGQAPVLGQQGAVGGSMRSRTSLTTATFSALGLSIVPPPSDSLRFGPQTPSSGDARAGGSERNASSGGPGGPFGTG